MRICAYSSCVQFNPSNNKNLRRVGNKAEEKFHQMRIKLRFLAFVIQNAFFLAERITLPSQYLNW